VDEEEEEYKNSLPLIDTTLDLSVWNPIVASSIYRNIHITLSLIFFSNLLFFSVVFYQPKGRELHRGRRHAVSLFFPCHFFNWYASPPPLSQEYYSSLFFQEIYSDDDDDDMLD
jgi:hypothetical protein